MFVTSLVVLQLASVSPAAVQIGLEQNEVVTCTVTSTTGFFGSFIPPVVGDKITFDLSAPALSGLWFESGAYVPTSDLPKLVVTDPWRTHQAFYGLVADPVFGDSTQVVIGAYGDTFEALTCRPWSALVQRAEITLGAEWTFAQMELACELVSGS